MKKLVIFLILLIFSTPTFAQDGSLFTENFSLIRDQGSNDSGFLSLKNPFPANYLFFTHNKRHSINHQTYQIFSYFQFSDRAQLSRIVNVENGTQKWGEKYNLIYGQQKNINSDEKSEALAEGYLKRLAERSKRSRKTWGTIWLVGGGVFLASGIALLSSVDEDDGLEGFFGGVFGVMAIATGVVLAGGGALTLAIPGSAERELDDVLSISDTGHRERASHVALSSLAARGRRKRIFWGILWAGFSAYALASKERSYLLAAEYGCFAVYNLMRKSRAERAFQSYMKEKEFQNKLKFRLGILPNAGVKIGLVYSF